MPETEIIAAGPGIGLSVARGFARKAMRVTLIARSVSTRDLASACPSPEASPAMRVTLIARSVSTVDSPTEIILLE